MSFEEFFADAFGSDQKPFSYQSELAASKLCDRIIRVPTGGGKTAAAILPWMWKIANDPENTPIRLILALPMRALVQQSTRNIWKWLTNLDLIDRIDLYDLLGGDGDLKTKQRSWPSEPGKPAILIGTIDLLLSAALNRGYAMSRFKWPVAFGLLHNSALWVVDEVQLMGRATATLAQLAHFRKLWGTEKPVHTWWMSATVEPLWLETVDAKNPPAITPTDRRTLEQELGEKFTAGKPLQSLKELAADAVLRVHGKQPALTIVVVNTVQRAQALYRELKKKAVKGGSPQIALLHSRFRQMEREAHTGTLINFSVATSPPGGLIVVATQVVEAGIDVSAQTMITELAPWDSLVQRFGRLNRYGETGGAKAFWVDIRSDVLPYTAEQIQAARERIRMLADVGPKTLEPIPLPEIPRQAYVLRQHDLYGLFSTEKDLAGGFTDVSEFIRDSDDRDVYLFWRDLEGKPGPDEAQPERAELCSVPIHAAKEFRKTSALYEWNDETGKWELRTAGDLVPGMVLLCDAAKGGYSEELGWTGSGENRPRPVQPLPVAASRTNDSVNVDPTSESSWYPLSSHLNDVAEEAQALASRLGLSNRLTEALTLAGRWHDVGKALPPWQRAVEKAIANSKLQFEVGLWAKFPARPGTFKPGFRHEEASALYAACLWKRHEPGWSALAVYLVAAHHGKVRTALGVFGTKQISDFSQEERTLPAIPGWIEQPITLSTGMLSFAPEAEYDPHTGDLSVSESSWTELLYELLGPDPDGSSNSSGSVAPGPFRLAFLEALITAADIRASRKAEGEAPSA